MLYASFFSNFPFAFFNSFVASKFALFTAGWWRRWRWRWRWCAATWCRTIDEKFNPISTCSAQSYQRHIRHYRRQTELRWH